MDGGRDDLLRVGQRAVRLSVITTRRSTLHSHAENSNKSTRTKQRRNSNRAANLANTVFSPAIHMCVSARSREPTTARFRQIPPEPSFRGTAYAGIRIPERGRRAPSSAKHRQLDRLEVNVSRGRKILSSSPPTGETRALLAARSTLPLSRNPTQLPSRFTDTNKVFVDPVGDSMTVRLFALDYASLAQLRLFSLEYCTYTAVAKPVSPTLRG